jgi:hypothetical protein
MHVLCTTCRPRGCRDSVGSHRAEHWPRACDLPRTWDASSSPPRRTQITQLSLKARIFWSSSPTFPHSGLSTAQLSCIAKQAGGGQLRFVAAADSVCRIWLPNGGGYLLGHDVKANTRFRGTCSLYHLLSRWFFAQLILTSWRWSLHVLLKRRLNLKVM